MSAAINFPRVPLMDVRTGLLTQQGVLFFQAIWTRAGGANGPSTTELQAQVDDLLPLAPALEPLQPPDDLVPAAPQPQPLEDPDNELAALREEVAALRRRIEDLGQGPTL